MKIALLYSSVVLGATIAVAAPTPSAQAPDEIWPKTINTKLEREFHRSLDAGMTNRERMKRGLGPAKPKTLFNPSRGIAKRLNPHPSRVAALDGVNSYQYDFDACYSTYDSFSGGKTVSADDNFKAVQSCANSAGGMDFMVIPDMSNQGSYFCRYQTSVSIIDQEDCTSSDWARYIPDT